MESLRFSNFKNIEENELNNDYKIDKGIYLHIYYKTSSANCMNNEHLYILIDQEISYSKLLDLAYNKIGFDTEDNIIVFEIINDVSKIISLDFCNVTDLIEIKSIIDFVDIKKQIKSVNKVIALQHFRKFKDSKSVEIGAVIGDYILLDDELEKFLRSLNCNFDKFGETSYMLLCDGDNKCYVPFCELPNRNGKKLGNELFMDFNNCILHIAY